MKELKSYKTTVFESGKYLVYITERKDQFVAWMTRKNYCIMEYMFGSPKKQHELDGTEYTIDFDYFCEIVEGNLPEYKRWFEKNHEEDE